MNLTLIKPKEKEINFTEVHQYTDDLQRVTLLRDKALTPDEKERYNNIIKCMQLVMAHINQGGIDG